MKKFEVFEHTADVGIRAFGKDLNEAFENAALGMFNIITDLKRVEVIGEYEIVLDGSDIEQMLVDWLSELLYIHTVKQIMFSDFKVAIEEGEGIWRLKGLASGENYNEQKHLYNTEIKAVTHHILEIKKNKGYTVQVLFDI